MSQTSAEDLFFQCVSPEGALDEARLRAVRGERPDLDRELLQLQCWFERGREAVRGPSRLPDVLDDLRRGRRDLRRYRLIGEVGRGGMGIVYRAWDPQLRRVLALKVLGRGKESSQLRRDRARLRMLEEAQVIGQLQHPSIVPVFDLGVDEENDVFFTMPLIEGEDLERVVQRVHDPDDDWSLPRFVATLQRVCEAVAHAHSKGVLHRDLKPQNVMVGTLGETYVMDWGLAKIVGEVDAEGSDDGADASGSSSGVSSDRSDLARTSPDSLLVSQLGNVVGTPAYMAPEQASGASEGIDERADVYGLGAILYRALANSVPYEEDVPEGARRGRRLQAVLSGPPRSLSTVVPRIPEELVAICERAMAREPSDRYGGAAEMGADLRAYLEGRVVRAHRTGAWVELRKWMGRHRGVVLVVCILFLSIAGSSAGFAWLWQRSEEHRRTAVAAQADSLRRQGALRSMAPVSFATPSFTDDFADGRLDRRWVVTHHPERVEERDGALRLTAVGSGEDTAIQLDPYVSVLRGDFDVAVHFRLEGFTMPEVERGGRLFSLAALQPGAGRILSITREVELRPAVCEGAEQTYRSLRGNGQVRTCAKARGVAGRLRLRRYEDTFTASFWDEGWVELASIDTAADAAVLKLQCTNWYVDTPFTCVVDELSVTTQAEARRRSLAIYRDGFDDGAIDSRLVVKADAGIAAEVDGRLHLEKLEGRLGRVELGLDSRWSLRGDGEVGFDYELLRFPRAAEGQPAFLSLRMRTPVGTPFGTIEVIERHDGRWFKAFYHDFRELVSTQASTGRLRVRRVGTDLHFEYEDDGWRTLLTRPHVSTDLELSFLVGLAAPKSAKGHVVALDDLLVSFPDSR